MNRRPLAAGGLPIDALGKSGNGTAERGGNPNDAEDTRIAQAPLDAADVRRIKIRGGRKLLLGEPFVAALTTNIGSNTATTPTEPEERFART